MLRTKPASPDCRVRGWNRRLPACRKECEWFSLRLCFHLTQEALLKEAVEMDLEHAPRTQIPPNRQFTHVLLRDVIPGSQSKPRLVQCMNPALQMRYRDVELELFLIRFSGGKPNQIALHDLERRR